MLNAATLWDLIEQRAAATPEAPALVDERDVRLTFAEYRDRAVRAAAAFHERGIRAGDTVAWQMPTWIETTVLMAALARLGVRQVPLLAMYGERELRFCLAQTATRWLVTPDTWRGTDFAGRASTLASELPNLSVIVCDRALPEEDPAGLPSAPAATEGTETRWVFYTSGTTSQPKGARHSDQSVMAAGMGLSAMQGFTPTDRFGVAFAITHVGGLTDLIAALAVGFELALLEGFDPEASTAAFANHGVTIIGGGPAFYRAFVEEQRRHPDRRVLPDLRMFSGGGAPNPLQLYWDVRRELDAICAHGYGMTEVPIIAMPDPRLPDDVIVRCVGRPIRGMEVRVVQADETEAPAGAPGEVRLRGPQVCAGYLDPTLNAAAFDGDGWFRTGDLGVVDADGFLSITGRIKDVIIRKGETISAQEVEALVASHPKVAGVAVIGLPDDERGELVCAVVQRNPALDDLTLAELVDHCVDQGVMKQKIPERLEIVDEFPLGPVGKIAKQVLAARYVS